MGKTYIYVLFITLISKFLGFGRELSLASVYGTSSISDVYLISTTIPSVIFSFFSTGIIAGYIPLYSEIREHEGDKKACIFTNNVLNVLFILCLIISCFCEIFTPFIVKLFAYGFNGEIFNLTVKFTRITILAILITVLVSIFTGLLQANNFFIESMITTIPLDLIIIIAIVLSSQIGIQILPLGYLVATISQLIVLLPFLKKSNFKYSSEINFKDPNLLKMFVSLIPIIISLSVNQINVLIDKTLASRLETGGISALNYADRITGLIIGIFVLTVISISYPVLSNLATKKEYFNFQAVLNKMSIYICLFVIPSSFGIMIFAKPVVDILFGRGAFDADSILLTAKTLFFYSIGMLGFGLREVLTRAFYSMQDTKTPTINAIIGMLINIALNLLLSPILGVCGLALGTSIAAILTTFSLSYSLKRRFKMDIFRMLYKSIIKILLSSLFMSIICILSYKYLYAYYIHKYLILLISILLGLISYIVMGLILKIDELDFIITKLINMLKNIHIG